MMRKNLRRAASLVVSLSLCASAFAGLTAHGYEAEISGWSDAVSDRYSWLQKSNVTEADMEATYAAVADELKYQNETLGFNIGTTNDGSTKFDLSNGWNEILHIQFENWCQPNDTSKTDNTGNPWNQTNDQGEVRKWGLLTVPFVGMAFTCKGQMAAAQPDPGQPILGNEFTMPDGITYQPMWDNTRMLNNGAVTTNQQFPGVGADGKDITNNTFRYAVAKYNQDNKRAGADGKGLHAGYAVGSATSTADSAIIYQEMNGPSGKAYLAVDASIIDTAKLTGAYLIPADLAAAFEALGDSMDARFAVTGAPAGEYANGEMMFAKGILTKSGFKSTAAEITGFSFGDQEAAPSVIDNEKMTVTAFVKDGANLSSLTPVVTVSGVSYTPAGAQDFSKPVTYTVTAAAGNTKEYTVTVVTLNNAAISTFKIADAEGVVDHAAKTVTIVVHADVDLSNVTPEVTFVDDGASMTPNANMNLDNSWNEPVEVTVTCGGDTAVYKIKARKMSTDNSIKSFTIAKDDMKYAREDVKAVIDNSARTISMVYDWGNYVVENGQYVPYAKVPVQVELPAGATISPDPTVERDQQGVQYAVTSENGDEVVYTVNVTLSDDRTFPAVDKLDLKAKNNWGRFSGDAEEAEFEAITEEYNYQRTVLGFDPGEISGGVEAWNDLLSRQFFINGSGTHNCLGLGTAMIAADVSYGKAYTLKDKMFEAWERGGVKDADGVARDGFSSSGSPVENEFVMDGTHYQQFAFSYGTYTDNGSVNRVINGVGMALNALNDALKADNSPFYDPGTMQMKEGVRNTIRDAYEGANKSGTNPGIALDGNLKYDSEHQIVYQVFSGTGDYHSTERSSANKTLIFKGLTPAEDEETGEIEMTSNGSAIALLPRIQHVYENIDLSGSEEYGENEYVEITLDGFTFKYSKTLGMPNSAPEIDENGDVVMDFAKGWVECKAGSEEVVWHDGNRLSGDNTVAGMEVVGDVERYEVHNVTDDGSDTMNAIRIHFASGAAVDLSSVTVNSITPNDANAKVEINGMDFEPGSTMNLTYNGNFKIVAENGGGRDFAVYAWQDGKALSKSDPDYNKGDNTSSGGESGSSSETGNDSSQPNNGGNSGTGNNNVEQEWEYGYYDENGVWHAVSKEFYDKWSGQGGNAKTGDAGAVGIVLLAAAAAGALVVLRKKK